MPNPTPERDHTWTYEADHAVDMHGAESLVENVESKAAADRAAVEAGGLTVGEITGLTRRADNYDLVADGLRRALDVRITLPGASS